MRPTPSGGVKLPKILLDELGVADQGTRRPRKHGKDAPARKDRRKAERVGKKIRSQQPRERHVPAPNEGLGSAEESKENLDVISTSKLRKPPSRSFAKQETEENSIERRKRRKLTLSKQMNVVEDRPRISKQVEKQLEQDDAEILALEKALGIKKQGSTSETTEDDGLDNILAGLSGGTEGAQSQEKHRMAEEDKDWLISKRSTHAPKTLQGAEDSLESFEGCSSDEAVLESVNLSDTEELSGVTSMSDEDDTADDEIAPVFVRSRENPYIAPVPNAGDDDAVKYVPPSRRLQSQTRNDEDMRLRRQIQGLLNRLSESNLLVVAGEVDRLYQNNPRQQVSSLLVGILLDLLADPTILQDTFLILHAGFVAAVYKSQGSEFGALVITAADTSFDVNYTEISSKDVPDKKCTNLIGLLGYLYSFQVISSALIYDYIRTFLHEISETNTELLLKLLRIAGHQLRQDDATSLQSIVTNLNTVVARVESTAMSVRTKFMIETVNNLKGNRAKHSEAASIASEHTIRMKKTLGTMNQRSLKGSEPLRVELTDLRDADRKGRWWLVGASYRGHESHTATTGLLRRSSDKFIDDTDDDHGTFSHDLLQLAQEQRMNTEIRRAIFIAIMSATDVNDAYTRLTKLRLKKTQELEIPKVLLHCAGSEKLYNPYYTFLSRRLCSSDRKLKMAFQFSLWDLFKRMGETDNDGENSSDDELDDENKLELRSVVNFAKLYSGLIASGSLTLGILKNLNLAYLKPKTLTFAEILFVSLILESQKNCSTEGDEARLARYFLEPKEMPQMASSLRYFLKKTVSKSDLGGHDKDSLATVKWGSAVACDALSALAMHAGPG